MARSYLSPAVALLSALLLAPVPEASALPRKKDRWIQVDTANFTLFSNASAATAKGVGTDLEQFRGVLSRLTTGELNAPIPTVIYVFSHDRAFRPYLPIRDGKPEQLSGLFQPREHGNYISINGALRTEASSTVYTMYAFYFLHNNLPGLPVWLNKGLAEYYGTLEFDKKYANIGKPDVRHVHRLRDNPMIPFAELFAATEYPDYRQGPRAYMFDAQCWAVVHYLLTAGEQRRGQAFAYVGLIMKGIRRDAAFEKAFQTTYDGLQREVKSYVRKFKFGYLRHELPQTKDDSARVQPLAWADVLYRLGDLLVSQYDLGAALLGRDEALCFQRDRCHIEAKTGPGGQDMTSHVS